MKLKTVKTAIIVLILLGLFSCDKKESKLPLVTHGFIQRSVYIKNNDSILANNLFKLQEFDKVVFLLKGRKDQINNQEDFWYRVRLKNGKTGWVFGADTSLKQSEQKTAVLTFENYDFGDLEHYIFKDKKEDTEIDFGEGKNNLGSYNFTFLDEELQEYTGNPKYVGKDFIVTYNNLIAKVYCNYPNDTNICIKPVPTILNIKLIK